MRKYVLESLICPNTGASNFEVYAVSLTRDGKTLENLASKDILDDDDIRDGIIADFKTKSAFPIQHYVASVLSDEDADQAHYNELLTLLSDNSPEKYKKLIKESLTRLAKAKVTEDGIWNREEMEYYDADVATPEMRQTFLERIKEKPLWHVFIERKRHLIEKGDITPTSRVLEIGCGNARTIAHIAPPHETPYQYTGIDISWKRLLLAKQVLNSGDFIQASALNLPFKTETFTSSIAFGSLHHLPNRESGFLEALRVTKNAGNVLINEPIDKPQFISEEKFGWLRKMIEGYEHSEHDNDIDLNEFHTIIEREGHNLKHEYVNVSVLRTIITFGYIKKLPMYSTEAWWKFIIWLDKVFISIFCRKHTVLGPSGAYLVIEKVKKH